MTSETLHTLAQIHGLGSWLALALLLLSSVRSRRIPTPIPTSIFVTAAAATCMTSLSAAIGFALHFPYQYRLRQRIFLESETLGRLFERKEHLAFGALLLSWCALCALITIGLRHRARSSSSHIAAYPQNDAILSDLKRTVFFAFSASAVLAAMACVAASIVARRFRFSAFI